MRALVVVIALATLVLMAMQSAADRSRQASAEMAIAADEHP